MELLNLKLQGFGSFAETAEIDFSKMNGLWLVTGDTGAGKTTLFDAITFALFGTTSGKNRLSANSSMGLRSGFIGDKEQSFVELTFFQSGEKWTVHREPKWKKEGRDSDVPEKATLKGDSESFGNPKQVNEKIKELLHVDADQFRQLAMIAQNDFEKLVLEGSDERTKILRKLLDTDRFERFQRLIRDAANEAKRDSDAVQRGLRGYASEFKWDEEAMKTAETANYVQNMANADVIVTKELHARMEERLAREEKGIEAEKEARKPLEVRRSALQTELGAAEQLHRLFTELAQLKEAAARDEADTPSKEAEEKELAVRSAALDVKPVLDAAVNARGEAKKASGEAAEADAVCRSSSAALQNARKEAEKIPDIEKQAGETEAEKAALSSKLPAFDKLNKAKDELEAAKKTEESKKKAFEAKTKETSIISEAIKALEPVAEKKGDLKTKGVELKGERDKTAERIKSLTELMKAEALILPEEKLSALLSASREAVEAYREANDLFIANQYALVVTKLEEGKPCPICGSVHHPSPYKSDEGERSISAEKVAALREASDRAYQKYEKTKSENDAKSESVKDRKNELKVDGNTEDALSEAEKRLKELDNELVNLRALYTEADTAGKRLAEKKIELERAQNEEKQASEETVSASSKVKTLEGTVETLKGELPEGNEADIRKKVTNLDESARALRGQIKLLSDKLGASEKEEAKAKERSVNAQNRKNETAMALENAEKALTEALSENGFNGEDALKAMLSLSRVQVDAKKNAVLQWKNAKQNRIERLNTLMGELDGKTDTDPAAISARIKECEAGIAESEKREKQLNAAYTANKGIADRVRKGIDESEKALKKEQFFRDLDATASGRRGKNENFEVYIQRYYFRHVVQYANRRFMRMTDNMMELELNENNLDLNVMDYHTGKARPVNSLSGGEKFKAALSMALGMSDMIKSEVKNVDLGMLFIDEGFGTLDGNSIGLAIEILRQLSNDTGRLVSVISHREEMREGIEQKLYVKKHKDGDRQKGSYILTEE